MVSGYVRRVLRDSHKVPTDLFAIISDHYGLMHLTNAPENFLSDLKAIGENHPNESADWSAKVKLIFCSQEGSIFVKNTQEVFAINHEGACLKEVITTLSKNELSSLKDAIEQIKGDISISLSLQLALNESFLVGNIGVEIKKWNDQATYLEDLKSITQEDLTINQKNLTIVAICTVIRNRYPFF